jgi:hypothetical protein
MRDHSQMYLFQWNSCRVLLEAPDRGLVESASKLLALPFALSSASDIPPDLAITSQGSVYRRITRETFPCATREDLVLCLVALTSISFLEETASVVLHAGAFVAGGRAILFCGPAEAGKSCLAFTAWQRGHRLIGDDWVILNPDRTSVSPFPKPLKMRPPTGAAQIPPLNEYLFGRLMSGEPRWVLGRGLNHTVGYNESIPIGALFLINRAPGHTTSVLQANREEAVATVLRQTMRTRAPGLGALKILESLVKSDVVFRIEVGENGFDEAISRMVECTADSPLMQPRLPWMDNFE